MENIDSTTADKITDLEYLNQISKGNKKFAEEMIKIFLAENPSEIDALQKCIEERNFPLIKAAAHKLKSTMPFVGLDKILGNEVAEMEMLAESGQDIERIEKIFFKVKEICDKAYAELSAA
jgi:HPt (histidine-containing phosphotransfer) domain-containing protein